MSKCMISPEELILFWRKGWPNYVVNPIDDYPSLLLLAQRSAEVSGEDLLTEQGQSRIKLAITAIAMFCYCSDEFGKKNIWYAEKGFQRLVHEMQFAKRNDKLQQQIQAFNDYYDRDKRKAQENERLSNELSEKARKWVEENWTEENEIDYQRWIAGGMKVPSCKLK